MSAHGRKWLDHHTAAGYHLQDWGPPPTEKSELLGTYQGVNGAVTVRLVDGETGVKELEIEWENGPKVTVINEETALKYLALEGAVEMEPDAS